MSRHDGDIDFTDHVNAVQDRYGSGAFYSRHRAPTGRPAVPDAMTSDVRDFLAGRDSFYLATVSQTGWPYVQYRGRPPGLLELIDEYTLGWADFRGNLQYISIGNLSTNERVSMIVMDYPHRRRLKIFGQARVVFAEDDPALIATLTRPEYHAVVERGVVVSVEAFDWNRQQHITPRYTAAELDPHLAPVRRRIELLESENTALRDNCLPAAAETGSYLGDLL